jgi:hypothetical protein
MVPAPNIHANGQRYEIIGEEKEPIVLTLDQALELMRHIDAICIKYGLKYLQNTG